VKEKTQKSKLSDAEQQKLRVSAQMLQTCATKAETEKNYKAAFDFYK
jgi:hypothetical protein